MFYSMLELVKKLVKKKLAKIRGVSSGPMAGNFVKENGCKSDSKSFASFEQLRNVVTVKTKKNQKKNEQSKLPNF